MEKAKELTSVIHGHLDVSAALEKAQVKSKVLKPLQVVMHSETRWNSLDDLIDRLLVLYPHIKTVALKGVLDAHLKPDEFLNDAEIGMLKKYHELLLPLKIASNTLEGASYPTLCLVAPLLYPIMLNLARSPADGDEGPASRHLREALYAEMTERFGALYDGTANMYLCATAVNPKYATFSWMTDRDAAAALLDEVWRMINAEAVSFIDGESMPLEDYEIEKYVSSRLFQDSLPQQSAGSNLFAISTCCL